MRITVNDAAKRTGLSPYTIRYYLREGLLPTVERDRNGTRLFTRTYLELLGRIGFLRECGLSIQDIRAFISLYLVGDDTLPDRLTLLRDKLPQLERQLEAFRAQLDNMRYLILYYEKAVQFGHLSPLEDVPLHSLTDRDRDVFGQIQARLRLKKEPPSDDPS